MSRNDPHARRGKGVTVLGLVAIIGVMSLLVVFSVPLYRLFCAATGYNGTTQRASLAPDTVVKNPNATDVDTITLSYTMFRARGGAAAERTAVLPATASAN